MAKHRMSVLGASGDAVGEWDPENPKSVQEAKAMFEQLTQSVYLAFADTTTDHAEQVKTFDPARDYVLAPVPIVG